MNAERRSRIEITAPGPLGAPGSRRDAAHPLAFTARGALAIAASAVWALALAGCGSSGSNSGSGAAPAPIAGSSATGSTGTDSVAPHSAPPALEAGAELGEKVFKQRCVLCHGSEGRGNGGVSHKLGLE